MNSKTPKIDTRNSIQVYNQALALARIYCPEWLNVLEASPNKEDIGIALLSLFSRLVETVIGQVNRIPEKHLLAFYDFIGIDHKPPAPAKAPLTFMLSEGSKEASIPARTRVSSSEDPTVIFETMEHLTAVNFIIKSAYSLNTWDDKYTEHGEDINGSKEEFYVFGGDGKEKQVEHILYLADDLFDFKTPIDVIIKFTFTAYKEAFKDYFSVCADGTGKELFPKVEILSLESKQVLALTFEQVTIPQKPIDGKEANWISFRPKGSLPILKDDLPEIKNITCDVTAYTTPDAVLFNDTPIDVKKGFYPFGEIPKVGDTFYIGCSEAFSKKDSTISIILNLKGGAANNNLSLAWEYWNGSKWTGIDSVKDATNNFTLTDTKKSISFTCPPVKTVDINGVSSRWIRVRIVTGGYGDMARYDEVRTIDEIVNALSFSTEIKTQLTSELTKQNIKLGMKYLSSTLKPPFINTISIQGARSKPIQWCKTYNNFEYKDVEKINGLKPFEALSEEKPVFYLGFEEYLVNKAITLYFSLKGISYSEDVSKIKAPGYSGDSAAHERVQGFEWEYYSNNNKWEKFGPEDGTELLSKSGIIKFIVPSDIKKRTEFGKHIYWIRIKLKEGFWYEPPRLKGIFTNTVWAENAAVIKNELLGTSNGQPDQISNFSSKPVLENQIIEIKEPGIPSDDELSVITSEEGSDSLRMIKNDSGDIQEVWVRWHEVNAFVNSYPNSRHYVIDRVEGKIVFGDGIRGMIPPALPNNILAREYKSGGGKKGNQQRKTLAGMKTTVPNIQGVTNHDSSTGGADLETISDILARAPHSIKNRGRAVTKEDFEWLAIEASPEVSKAKCIKEDEGTIKIIIAPLYADGSLHPDTSLTDYVETYLKDRAFAPVRSFIEVIGPTYVSIHVKADIVPVSISEAAIVADKVERRLKQFLDPIKGGHDRKGWNFGEDIFFSKVAAEIEDVEGVDYIKALELNDDNLDTTKTTFIDINDNELPRPGDITVRIIGEKD